MSSTDDGTGNLLRAMLGPPEPHEGPPYVHVGPFRPLTRSELATVERGPRGRLHELAPLETSTAFRRLLADALTATVGIGCYFPLTDP